MFFIFRSAFWLVAAATLLPEGSIGSTPYLTAEHNMAIAERMDETVSAVKSRAVDYCLANPGHCLKTAQVISQASHAVVNTGTQVLDRVAPSSD